MPVDHPDRKAITEELHARPVDIIEGPARVRRLVFVIEPQGGADALIGRFNAFCKRRDIDPLPRGLRQTSFVTDARAVTWEFHTEFATITWRAVPDDAENWPADVGLDAVGDAQLIAATRIDVIAGREIPSHFIPQFNLSSLCVSLVEDGAGQIATDYLADSDGYTRLEFAAGGLTPLRRSILVRRLLEIDTYRSMAMLALPLARRASPELSEAERDLTALIETLAAATSSEAIQAALEALHRLSIRSGQLSERLDYRFAAAKAYGRILQARLDGLREGPTALGSTIGRYLGNRVDPALATCLAVEKRLETLTGKIERAIELLNVRIGLDLQIQNKSVLETIASTAQSQFRLQATVEGLSVIAISYYALGILGYVLAGPLEIAHFDKALAVSIAAPIIIAIVWAAVRRVRACTSAEPAARQSPSQASRSKPRPSVVRWSPPGTTGVVPSQRQVPAAATMSVAPGWSAQYSRRSALVGTLPHATPPGACAHIHRRPVMQRHSTSALSILLTSRMPSTSSLGKSSATSVRSGESTFFSRAQ